MRSSILKSLCRTYFLEVASTAFFDKAISNLVVWEGMEKYDGEVAVGMFFKRISSKVIGYYWDNVQVLKMWVGNSGIRVDFTYEKSNYTGSTPADGTSNKGSFYLHLMDFYI